MQARAILIAIAEVTAGAARWADAASATIAVQIAAVSKVTQHRIPARSPSC